MHAWNQDGIREVDICITSYELVKLSHYNTDVVNIGSFARNFYIGFDPGYELIKNTRPVSDKTPDDRIV